VHFGRIESADGLEGIDLAVPEDAPRTKAFLKLPWKGAGRIHAGCPVWVSNTWVGSLYAPGTKPAEYLSAYAAQLGTVELNSTFYQQLDAARMAAWAERAGPAFRFCPKVYRGITEQPGGPAMPDLVRACAASFAALGPTLGLAFAQFPETFGFGELPLLQRFLARWPRAVPLAVELRHPSWFAAHVLRDDAVNALYRHGAATVITDTAGRRDVLHTSLSQPRVLVRFQGNRLLPSDTRRLGAWAERCIAWAEAGMQDVYFICHQPDDAMIPRTVNVFLRGLQMRGRVEPAPWRDLAGAGLQLRFGAGSGEHEAHPV
jgi:uncharacterized protein YecE (DUF72 family)